MNTSLTPFRNPHSPVARAAQFAVAALCLLLALPAHAAHTLKVLYDFTGAADGGSPQYALIRDAAGNLYGVTTAGGASGNGAVFQLAPNGSSWTQTVLYSFAGGTDGAIPAGRLVMDSAGNLYGMTSEGGAHAAGTVYKLAPSGGTWKESILFSFTGYPNPSGGLTLGANGTLYGTTLGNGYQRCYHGCGLVFSLSLTKAKKWKYTIVYKFLGHTVLDGEQPIGDLVFDAAGNLYGTTFIGGTFGETGGFHGYGTVFELSPSGTTWTEKILHNFAGATTDGSYPGAGVSLDSAGNVYATTTGGGILNSACAGGDGGCGVVVKLSPNGGSWTESILYQFTGGNDGAGPDSPLTFDAAGNLYSTAPMGGSKAGGVLYELSLSKGVWVESVLHPFLGKPDGQLPEGGVVMDPAGNFYGNTLAGGTGNGIVYQVGP
jgi:uncharacterized repeat protein (TIGR03803 family)